MNIKWHWIILLTIIQYGNLFAEVVVDGSLGVAVQSLPGPNYTIEQSLGRSQNGNLFHSFSQFNINSGESANFLASDSISNIFARVTGGNASLIDGGITSNSPANLWLINPAGWMIGKDAAINLSGSFSLSTATSLEFKDGGAFLADPNKQSSLSFAEPVDYQFQDAKPSTITIDRANLAVKPGKDLSLLGGDIHLLNAHINAPGGRILIGSNAGSQGKWQWDAQGLKQVNGQQGMIDIEHDQRPGPDNPSLSIHKTFRDQIPFTGTRGSMIQLTANQIALKNALISIVSGINQPSVGNINLIGETIDLAQSVVSTSAFGNSGAGNISIVGKDLNMTGSTDSQALEGSFLKSEVGFGFGNRGNGGSITIDLSGTLNLSAQSSISSTTFGSGKGGNIAVNSDVINLREQSSMGIATLFGTGDSGSLSIKSHNLSITQDAFVESSSLSGSQGNGGDISIVSPYISLDKGSIVAESDPTSSGATGNIAINPAFSETSNYTNDAFLRLQHSLISTTNRRLTQGDGGNISADTGTLVMNGGYIQANSAAQNGSGGKVTVNADRTLLSQEQIQIGGNVRNSFDRQPDLNIIQAAAPNGESGEVNVSRVELNIAGQLAKVDASVAGNRPIASDPCSVARGEQTSSMVQTGNGGLMLAASDAVNLPLQRLLKTGGFSRADSALFQQGEAALAKGQLNKAIRLLRQARQQKLPGPASWLAGTALAEALIRAGQLEPAEVELNSVYETVKTGDYQTLAGEIALRYGHLYAAKTDTQEAQSWYRIALAKALAAQDLTLAAAASINLTKQSGQLAELRQARQYLEQVPVSEDKNTLLLALGYQASQQNQFKLAVQSFQEILTNTGIARNKAQALGYLGWLYEQQHRYTEALKLTELALLTDSAPDQHLHWTWQRARLLEKTGDNNAALSEYRSTVQQLQNIRLDIPVIYYGGESSFKQTFAPIYLKFIDLLLQRAEQSPQDADQPLLSEALQIWEQLKAFELQDYFKDACALKQKSQIARLDPNSVMLYPILLNGHISLVLRAPDKIRAYRVNHSIAELTKLVNLLGEQIGSGGELTAHFTLYEWLIAPIQAVLERQHIDTIVYLPDGVLRKVPFSLLSDGDQYLIERYATVTVPGLSMLSAPSIGTDRQDILLAGMSQPGPVVDELVTRGINIFAPSETKSRGLARGFKRRTLAIGEGSIAHPDLTERNLRVSRLKEELALPGVTEELENLANLSDQPILENAKFLLSSFEQAVNQGRSFIHIASHGYFSGDPKKSFIMAYDRLLTMEQLTTLFQTEAIHDRPTELVTLSACETAEGDDRSPLGLSGVVVKTGVKSAIGTLWPVIDEAARQFFSDFYKQYQKPTMTKAKAMQYAQKQLIKNEELNHPVFWGPFVLVGEWH